MTASEIGPKQMCRPHGYHNSTTCPALAPFVAADSAALTMMILMTFSDIATLIDAVIAVDSVHAVALGADVVD